MTRLRNYLPRGASFDLQRGFGLLESMAVILLLGGALVAGYLGIRSHQASEAAQAKQSVLSAVDEQLASYAAVYERLPCPDVDRDGREDCASPGQKGWLPFKTLGLEGVAAEMAATGLVYLVQRHAVDLTTRANLYEPFSVDAAGGYTISRALGQISTADICRGIQSAIGLTPSAADAQSGAGNSVAYAVVHSGANNADGNADPTPAGVAVNGLRLFDGINGDFAAARVELPQRGASLGTYDDVVRMRTYQSLSNSLNCARLLQSLDGLSMAVDVTEEVKSQSDATHSSATFKAVVSSAKIALAAFKISKASTGTGVASARLIAGSAELSGYIASCVVLVGCGLIPKGIAEVVASGVATSLYTASIVANVGSMVSNVVAVTMASIVAAKAGSPTSNSFNVDDAKAAALTNQVDAIGALAISSAKLSSAQTNKNNAETNVVNTRNNMANGALAIINYANSLDTCDPNNTAHTAKGACPAPLTSAYYSAALNAVTSTANTYATSVQTTEDAANMLRIANERAATPPAGSQVPVEAIDNLNAELTVINKQLDPADAAYITDAGVRATLAARKVEVQSSLDYLTNPANQSTNLTTASRLAQMDQDIAALNGQITELSTALGALPSAASCTPTPTTEPLMSQCAQRDGLAAQLVQTQGQRDQLVLQRVDMSLNVADAATTYNNAVVAQTNALNSRSTAISNFAALFNAVPYRYCGTVYVEPNSGIAFTVPLYCQNRFINYGWYALDLANAYVNSLSDLASKTQILAAQQTDYEKALSSKNRADTAVTQLINLSGDPNGTGLAVVPWTNALGILRTADGKGGVR